MCKVLFHFLELLFCFPEVLFYSSKTTYCSPELPFSFPDLLSFFLLCVSFCKNADCTFPLILLRVAQRDNICLALVLFPLVTIYLPTYGALHLACVHIQAINKLSEFLHVNSPWYNFKQDTHIFFKKCCFSGDN